MYVEVSPRRLDAVPGQAQPLSITIANTSEVISGYALRFLGADPDWVTIEDAEISLFPGETRTIVARADLSRAQCFDQEHLEHPL